jgi:hypothetical protein
LEIQPIRIRKDNKWFLGEVEMFRRNILKILAAKIIRDEAGGYAIQMGEEINPITVEDEPFLAQGIYEENGKKILLFYDLQEMVLDHECKLYFKGDVPYITFRWPGDTRLSRGLYWALSDYFEFRGDEVYVAPDKEPNQLEAE